MKSNFLTGKIFVGLLVAIACTKNPKPTEPVDDSSEQVEETSENATAGNDAAPEASEATNPPDTSGAAAPAAQVAEMPPAESAPAAEPTAPMPAEIVEETAPAQAAVASNESQNVGMGGGEAYYIVQGNDNLARISTKIYGRPDQWRKLAEKNGLKNPSRIFPGDKLAFATEGAKATAFAEKYAKRSMKQVQVKRGDTLSSISARVLGDDRLWKILFAVNQSTLASPNQLAPGMVLEFCPADKGRLESGKSEKIAAPAVVSKKKHSKKHSHHMAQHKKARAPEPVAQPQAVPEEATEAAEATETTQEAAPAPQSETQNEKPTAVTSAPAAAPAAETKFLGPVPAEIQQRKAASAPSAAPVAATKPVGPVAPQAPQANPENPAPAQATPSAVPAADKGEKSDDEDAAIMEDIEKTLEKK